jgi:hypothetical protein
MKIQKEKFKKVFSKNDRELLQETLQNKNKATNMENIDFQNDFILLKQERQKRYYELDLWFKNEYTKLMIKHQQKLKEIQIQ